MDRSIKPIILLVLFVALIGISSSIAMADNKSQQADNPKMSSTHYSLDWTTSGGTSGGGGSSAHYGMNQVTISQMAASSLSASQRFSLCTGWECGGPLYGFYLPTVMK